MPEPALDEPHPPPLFGDHDYEIAYAPREHSFEVRIRGHLATPPVVGDSFTLDRGKTLHDLVVVEVRRHDNGAWSARCRVEA